MGTMTADRFAKGMTYDAFKDAMTRNRDKVEANEARVKLSADDLAAFKRARPLRVMALAADWCGDVVANLPVLMRIAKESGTLDVRIFERDQNADLMDRYLNQGQFKSIPVLAFFDDGWKEVGVFIERPDSVTEMRAKKRREIFAAHPEFGSPDAPVDQLPEDVRARVQEELARMRDATTDEANAHVIRDIRAIVEGRATSGGAAQRAKGA